MLISDDRINYLARGIAQTLSREGLLATANLDSTTQEIRRALNKYCQAEAAIDIKVRTKIASLKRGVPEGSNEWEILYQKYYEDELNKQ